MISETPKLGRDVVPHFMTRKTHLTSDVFEYRQIASERAVSEYCSQFMPVYKWKWEREALDE